VATPTPISRPPAPLRLRDELRALPRPVWALLAGTFVNRFGQFVVVFLVLYLTSRGHSVARAGLAVALYGAGSLASTMVGGWLTDRVGRRETIALSMFSAAGALLALSAAESYAAILPLAALTGFTAELYRPASAALLTDLSSPGRRVGVFALYRLAINAGVAAGPAAAGFLARRSFTLLFVVDAVTCAIFGVVALLALPSGGRHLPGGPARSPRGAPPWSDRPFLALLVATTLVALVFTQGWSTLPLHVADAGLTPAHYGVLMSLNGALIVVLEMAIASRTRRLALRPVLVTGLLLVGLGFGLTGLAGSMPLLALTVVIWSFGEMVWSPVASAHVAEVAPEAERGRYHGAFQFAFGVGFVLGPALGTALYAFRPGVLWLACVVSAGLAATLIALAVGAPATAPPSGTPPAVVQGG
jgi:MFS family permease